MKVGVVAYSTLPFGRDRATVVIARAPLPPLTLSTATRTPSTRARRGARSRRKTSLPPPGLECVVNITTRDG